MQNKSDKKLMLQIEAECLVDNSEKLDYPPVALSLGKKYISTKDGSQMLPIPIGTYGNFSFVQSPPKTKKTFIEYLLQDKIQNTGLIIIDGIADLVGDVNNLEESNACVQKLMEWSSIYECHIITVIHSNYGSSKPTGHLGSFLEKKCETQIELEANTVNKEWVTVKCKRSRGYPFETFSFQVNDLGLPEVVGDLYDPLKDNEKGS